MMALILVVLLAFIAVLTNGAIEADRVTSMPGLKGGIASLPSTHYSGKLSGVSGKLHYWLIESSSPTAATDPLVVWFNGGPGSSSLIGLLTELGQIQTNDDSLTEMVDGVPQVFLNPYSWNTQANIIYLESPKGVGFSHCDGANVKSSADCVNTDESTALDAYEALVNFFVSYPEYKNNKFYLTGESYAGIYIPMLADQIDKDVLNAKINFVGAAVGNGCIGNTVGTCAFTSPESSQISSDFLYGHGFFSQTLREEMVKECGDWSRLSARCISKISQMEQQAGDFDIYNIYDECGSDQRRRRQLEKKPFSQVREEMAKSHHTVSVEDSFKPTGAYTQALGDYICGSENAMDAWLASPAVQQALHVTPQTIGMQYKKTVTSLLPLYSSLIEKYQILIYSGDIDGCVPYVGTENWTRGLNFTVVNDWHQWMSVPDDTHSSHKAGYAVTYDKFQFITINGAGHMVPQYQPAFALQMFKNFLANAKF